MVKPNLFEELETIGEADVRRRLAQGKLGVHGSAHHQAVEYWLVQKDRERAAAIVEQQHRLGTESLAIAKEALNTSKESAEAAKASAAAATASALEARDANNTAKSNLNVAKGALVVAVIAVIVAAIALAKSGPSS